MEFIKDISYGVKKNDMKVIQSVFKGYSGKISGICYRYVKDKNEVDLIVENVFLDFFNFLKKGSYNNSEDRKILSVLRDLTFRLLFSHYNNSNEEKTFDQYPDYKEKMQNEVFEKIDAFDIIKKFDSLSILERFVFNMSLIDGYNMSEVSEILKEDTGIIEQSYSSAKIKLIKQLKEKEIQIEQ